ncbi:hypothetical protein [Acinetobacter larvae]|uniref:DUF2946 domain-containing protein n=1 Tax=Acinetobacter larvae TaxID=1789224 RepID=A0A1B2LWN6_9GAMM|nr:hypothetical protein [Acinetobacter larvae]AOA57345.1 hypothetical protein BFG52_02545 [Acinetobacter larvae]
MFKSRYCFALRLLLLLICMSWSVLPASTMAAHLMPMQRSVTTMSDHVSSTQNVTKQAASTLAAYAQLAITICQYNSAPQAQAEMGATDVTDPTVIATTTSSAAHAQATHHEQSDTPAHAHCMDGAHTQSSTLHDVCSQCSILGCQMLYAVSTTPQSWAMPAWEHPEAQRHARPISHYQLAFWQQILKPPRA